MMTRSLTLSCLALLAGAATASPGSLHEEAGRWRTTLERVSTGVVSIRVDGTRAFDTEWNQSSQATGFVVDAERGLILTNRHVVMPGPVVAEAVFLNHEEVELKPVYRDPVHDFGFYQYDPSALQYIQPAELALEPRGAEVGREIRVVGNDAGEQISILAGTIARLDRSSPDYGRGKYNDFNTFYLQAASSTSGGSSGSPVVDIRGRVVALNAGANTQAASSFFLPLDRVRRALELIQEDEPVTRGTLMTVFRQRPYDELRRLGLRPETEALVREQQPDQTGLLVVNQIVPGSPAAGRLEPGDILVRVDGQLVTRFVPLAEVLDGHVGETLEVEVERGGEAMVFELDVVDLHGITPDRFLHFGDAVVHQLSYQQARHLNVAADGVYVANPGYIFATGAIPRGAVVKAVNGEPTPTLDAFIGEVSALRNGDRLAVRYFSFDDPRTEQLRVVRMDRRWFPAQICHRDDGLGAWPCVALADPGAAPPPKPSSTTVEVEDDPRVRRLAPSLVMVNFDMPYAVSGVSERHYHGTGVIVDAERGLVVVDRNTVPVALGDVRITFAGSLEVPGRVVYIHPLHNVSLVAYDPALIGETPVRAAEMVVRDVEPGETVWVVGRKGDHRLASQASEVASIESVFFPLSRTMRFRDTNLETLALVNPPTDFDGVLVDRRGRVLSLWSSFAYQTGQQLEQTNKGLPADIVVEMVDRFRAGGDLRSMEAEFVRVPLSAVRKLGLDDEWVGRLEAHDSERRSALQILRLVAGTPAARQLRTGDILLAIDGEVVTGFREVERAAQAPTIDVTVWRDGRELSLSLETVALDGQGLDRIVMWAGALLQAPHRAMAAQRGIEPRGVYISWFAFGSPANRYGLRAGRRIVSVDGQPVHDLDGFLAAVADRPDRSSIRLHTVSWNNAVSVITLKLDHRYWPAYELRRDDDGWHRRPLPGERTAGL